MPYHFTDSDHVASDDLDAILEMSRLEDSVAGPSSTKTGDPQSHSRKRALREEMAQMDIANEESEAIIKVHEASIRAERVVMAIRYERYQKAAQELRDLEALETGQGKVRKKQGIDYGNEEFEWTQALKSKMKEVFGIDDFRLCQEAVCNANMDGRDIVCVMPTGGGKSLTYQLPALLHSGCTLVISPLISLITDQILHLLDAGVQAVKLTGGTSAEESREITRRLTALANDKVAEGDEIKLCYVTPEKIAKNKSFGSLLGKLANGGKLSRIVIDEAHCVSQLGHDFRPDYQKLHTLRQLYPRVPIMALSATCPPKVLEDLIDTLGLKPVVDGFDADTGRTTYFSSPLYRKNLHYSILPKPAKSSDAIKMMKDYILAHHANDSGIIYCLTRKDTENVAEELATLSGGKIKTGVYHAFRDDGDKESLHKAWRRGSVKVVCATIAFGLGIDKGDVRFVLHHTLAKSVEGYYQESGRAGRDGKDSDCVLYYRPQDGTTMSSMISSEKGGQSKLQAMLDFAQNLVECRKTQFAKYFSHSSQLSISSWTTNDSDALTPCGHCDNCLRAPEDLNQRNITLESWQLLQVVTAVEAEGGNLTLNMLAALARGYGGGAFEVAHGRKGKGKTKEKVGLDIIAIAGGKVDLSSDDIEHLIVHLLVQGYLKEKYIQTSYTTNAYITLGPLAPRLTRHSREVLGDMRGIQLTYTFRKPIRKLKEKPSSSKKGVPKISKKKNQGKRKRNTPDNDDDDEITIAANGDSDDSTYGLAAQEMQTNHDGDSGDETETVDGWLTTMRSIPPSKKRRTEDTSEECDGIVGTMIKENDRDVLVLSD